MQTIASIALALIWAISGFYAKILRGTPRHQLIVARFIGPRLSRPFTIIIGCVEVAMSGWILWGHYRMVCFAVQALAILTMNTLEYWRARDLLLFPRLMPLANALLLLVAFWWSRQP